MSIIVKGMEMPTTGLYLVGVDNGGRDKTVVTVERMLGNIDARQIIGSFELVPIPPHGDLIDRDAAKRIIKPWSPEDERSGCTFDTVKKLMHTMLDRTPTIIEAEASDEIL